jgi:hypothetical protein
VGTIRVLAGKVAKGESNLADMSQRRDSLQASVNAAISKCAAVYDPAPLIDLIKQQTPEANEVRLKLRAEIRKRVYRIGVIFYPNGTIGFAIDYVNGVRRPAVASKSNREVLLVG